MGWQTHTHMHIRTGTHMKINLKHNSNISACSIFYSSLSAQTGKNVSSREIPLCHALFCWSIWCPPLADFCAIQEGTFWPTYWRFFLLTCYKCHLALYLLSQLWWLEQDKLSKEECLFPKWFTKMNTSSSTKHFLWLFSGYINLWCPTFCKTN